MISLKNHAGNINPSQSRIYETRRHNTPYPLISSFESPVIRSIYYLLNTVTLFPLLGTYCNRSNCASKKTLRLRLSLSLTAAAAVSLYTRLSATGTAGHPMNSREYGQLRVVLLSSQYPNLAFRAVRPSPDWLEGGIHTDSPPSKALGPSPGPLAFP